MKYYNHAEECCNKILAAFENGTVPAALKQVYIHKNDDIPCNRWSISNQLLMVFSGTSDARGFRQWKEVGRSVKKGEKAFYILIPLTGKKKNEETGEDDRFVYGFSSAPVFGIEQTDVTDAALWASAPKNDESADTWAQSLPFYSVADSWGLNVATYSGKPAGYLGFYTGSKIAVGVENLSTWAHELNHAADDRNGTMSRSKIDREIVAELGGAVLLSIAGEDTAADLGGCWEYVNRYARDEKKKVISVCMALLKRICKNVSLILDTAEELKTMRAAA